MGPLISIIIPVYNVEKYLTECIESVINQTYKNIEIILINDGSFDNSVTICKQYLKIDTRIKYFYKKNSGLSSARNYGLTKINGDYVCFIDSDDYINKNYIEELYNNLASTKCDIAICGYYEISQDEISEKYVSDVRQSPRILSREDIWNEFYFKRTKTDSGYGTIVCWNKMFKVNLLYKFKFKDIIHEDEYAMNVLFNKSSKICVIDRLLYYYRFNRDGSITNVSFKKIEHRPLIFFKYSLERTHYFIKKRYSISIIDASKNEFIYRFFDINTSDRRKYLFKFLLVIYKLYKLNVLPEDYISRIQPYLPLYIRFLIKIIKFR